MTREAEQRTAFEHYVRTGRRTSPGDIEVKFNPYHDPIDGRFTFAPGGPKERPEGRRPSGGEEGSQRLSVRRVELTAEEYIARSEQLWATIEGQSDRGFRDDREVGEAVKKVLQAAETSTENVEASPDMWSFVSSVAGTTAKARLAGGQKFEKTLTLARRADGQLVVASVGVVGAQGGSVPGIDARTIAVVHVHYRGLDQRPFTGDNSAVKFRSIPSFVVAAETGEVWEVGRRDGKYVQRIVRRDGTTSSWRAFR